MKGCVDGKNVVKEGAQNNINTAILKHCLDIL